jgi:NAD(P)-dependent dehydrogenase (short-subunit alcohol dehydrogenase family)
MTSPKVWFITCASRGFGRVWTEAALKRGDRVAAAARNPETLGELVSAYGDAVVAAA